MSEVPIALIAVLVLGTAEGAISRSRSPRTYADASN